MANGGNRFINLDRNIVASGLTRLLNQGIGTPVGGVPSFNDSDMRRFLSIKNLDTPTTSPSQPLEDNVGSIAIDPSVRVSQDLSGLLALQERITEATIRKNEIATLNLQNIGSDPQVASAKEALNQAAQDMMFNFVPANAPLIERQRQQAEAALLTAEGAARERAAIQTAAEVSEIDNEILRLQNQENSLRQIIAQDERIRPSIPSSVQQSVVAAEGLEDLTEVQTTWENYNEEKKQQVKAFAALDPGKFFAWDSSIVQDVDRDAYIAMVKSRLPIEQGRRFEEMIPQFDRQLSDAQEAAKGALASEQNRLIGTGGSGQLDSFAAQKAWVDNHIAQTMQNNTGRAFDTFAKGAVPQAITREGFSSDEMWRAAQQLQGNMDPTKANMQGAIATALSNMPPMDPDKRTQLITEYMRKIQNTFNEPRNVFGMGINQVTIDTLADDISNRLIRIDAIQQRQQLLEAQAAPLGQEFAISEGISPQGSLGGIPDSRAATAPTTIITSGQTAADVALAPVIAARGNGTEVVSAVRAAKIAADNPGLLEEEVAMLASSAITGVSNFLNELNVEEFSVVIEQMRMAAGLATDPGEKNMFELMLNKMEKFAQQRRQPKIATDTQGNPITTTPGTGG